MNIDSHIHIFGAFERIGHFEACACGHNHTGKQLVYVCRAVGRTKFGSLLLCRGNDIVGFKRISLGAHVGFACPSQRYEHENRTVAVTPAYVGGSFLMGYETQVRGWYFVAEGSDCW